MHISKVLASAVACVSLVGCSSVGDLKGRQSEYSFNSQQSARVVAGCISDGYVKAFPHAMGNVVSRVTASGYSVHYEFSMGLWGKTVSSIAETYEAPNNASRVDLYFAFDMLQPGKDKVRNIVQACI